MSQRKGNNTPSFIEIMLVSSGIFFIFSSIIWSITSGGQDKWFGRLCIGLVCIGFVGVIREIRKLKK